MKKGLCLVFPLSVALWALLPAGCRTSAPFGASRREALAEDIIAGWSKPSRLTAAAMIDKYGPPDALAAGGLGWKDKGRWRKIVLWDRAEGRLEQTVAYAVPEFRRRELEAFGDKVRLSPDGTWMSARSDGEAFNHLALNLAAGIGRGVIDAPRARASYDRAVALSRAGKTPPLMRGLLFPPDS